MIQHYRTLGLHTSASAEDVKKAYKKLAMKYHPDRNSTPGAEAQFKQIKEAYEQITNTPEPTRTHNYNYNDVFNAYKHSYTPKKPTYFVKVSLEQAYTGTTVDVHGHCVAIPKGVRTGNKLFLDTIIVEVQVIPHEKFKRTNDDLLVDVNISAIEAMLGIEVVLIHISEKKFKFDIVETIQPGQIMKLKGKGMPNPETDKYGDLLVRVNILIPRLTSEEKCSIMNVQNRKTVEI